MFQSHTEWPSTRVNLVENENYLNIPGELRESCVFPEHHFTCCVYGSMLSYCMTCLCSPDHTTRMKLKLVPEIYVCESACVSIAESWPYTQEHEQTHTCTHTDVHRSSISVQSQGTQVRDKSCLVHLSLQQDLCWN